MIYKIINSPFILITALVAALGSMYLGWAIGNSWESKDLIYYQGTDILHKNLALLPLTFYGLAIVLVAVVNLTDQKKQAILKLYKGLFFLNFLPMGAFLFVMIIDYHTSTYFLAIEGGYILWLVANGLMMIWLYAVCYTNIALETTRTDPQVLDDLPAPFENL